MISSFALLNKPAGISSFKALSRLKKELGIKKVGHCGTLDPFARGALLTLTGKMTRFFPYVSGMPKEYVGKLFFGAETDTLDIEGKITANSSHIPSYDEIAEQALFFKGGIMQQPPLFSALHVNGVRAYEIARRGERAELPLRKVTIYDFALLDYDPPELLFRIKCSSGTYIRSVARDLALKCGSLGYLTALKRTSIGGFSSDCAEPGDYLLFPPEIGIKKCGIETVRVDAASALMLREGKEFRGSFGEKISQAVGEDERKALFDDEGGFAAFVEKRDGDLRYIFSAGTGE